MKRLIRKTIEKAITKLYPSVEADFSVDYAPEATGADFSSNVALVLARKLGKKPMEIGSVILNLIQDPGGLGSGSLAGMTIQVAAPGFLNFKVETKDWLSELKKILKEGDKYGQSKIGKNKKLNVEFVSANPTGPLTVGHGPGATIRRPPPPLPPPSPL